MVRDCCRRRITIIEYSRKIRRKNNWGQGTEQVEQYDENCLGIVAEDRLRARTTYSSVIIWKIETYTTHGLVCKWGGSRVLKKDSYVMGQMLYELIFSFVKSYCCKALLSHYH